jgi:hypothetical protein
MCYGGIARSSTKHLRTLVATEQHTKNFLSVLELALVMFSGLVFFEFLTLLLWGAVSFSF